MLGKSIIVAALFLVAFVSVTDAQAAGVFGLDISSGISQTISQSGWSCLRTQGNYTFAIIEVRLCLSIILFLLFRCLCYFMFILFPPLPNLPSKGLARRLRSKHLFVYCCGTRLGRRDATCRRVCLHVPTLFWQRR